jgi:AcrR family transcriptional regulator
MTKAKRAVSPRSIKKAPSRQRSVSKRRDNRALILETTEMLMREEGYAAVSTRRVAKEAGLKPPLVHYYFATTDDLFLAVFRYAAEKEVAKLSQAVESEASLQSVWTTYCSREQTALAIEFMALANHRKAIREEIAAMTERERRRRAEILGSLINLDSVPLDGRSAAGLNVLLIGVARTLVMEQGLGVSLGHADANRLVEWGLRQLQKSSS